jgi:hypothetical protein
MPSKMLTLVTALLLALPGPVLAQDAPQVDATALAKQTQNPVANLISIPLQFNFNSGGDLGARSLFNLNVQPVIPFALNARWNFIARTIIPLNSIPGPDETRFTGVGDIQLQTFVAPSTPGKVIWGVGPAFSFPTATIAPNETGTWAMGLSAVVLQDIHKFMLGAVMSQLWPVSDAGGAPETNLFTLQPFVNYNFGKGWAVSYSPIITANWDASSGNEWTVPIGAGITRTTVFNRRPMNVGVQYYHNVERPDGAPGQVLRFVIALLYPGGK